MAEQELKYGLWEDGKRIEWFDRETADNIVKGKVDFRQYFRRTESAAWVPETRSFGKPLNFDRNMSEMKKKFNITN